MAPRAARELEAEEQASDRDHHQVDGARNLELGRYPDPSLPRRDGLEGPETRHRETNRCPRDRAPDQQLPPDFRSDPADQQIERYVLLAAQHPGGPEEGDVEQHRAADLVDPDQAFAKAVAEDDLDGRGQHDRNHEHRGEDRAAIHDQVEDPHRARAARVRPPPVRDAVGQRSTTRCGIHERNIPCARLSIPRPFSAAGRPPARAARRSVRHRRHRAGAHSPP